MAGQKISQAFGSQLQETVRTVRGWGRGGDTPPPRQNLPPGDHELLCKGTAAIAKGETGDMTIYNEHPTTDAWTDAGYDKIKVYAEMGAYTANMKAYVKRINGKFRIGNTECP